MIIASRQSWGGPSSPIGASYGLAMTAVTVHNTYRPALPSSATIEQERAAVLGMHRDHVGRGWAGIAYGLLIFQSGRPYEGRGWHRVGAHAGSALGNRTFGVAFVIDGETTAPSPAALRTFADVRAEGVRIGALTQAHTVKLHRDWKATICPGRKVIEALRAPSPEPPRLILRRGMTGPVVLQLQDLLVATRFMTQADVNTGPGAFGPRTDAAFVAFLDAHR